MAVVVLSLIAFWVALLAALQAFQDHRTYKRRLGQLERQVRRAEEILRQRGNLANEIAHEIKNPITAILCSAETLDLLIGESLAECHRKSLGYIKEYGDYLLRLVSDFLDVSRAESGKIESDPRPVGVAPVVESILGLLQSKAIAKQIQLRSFFSDPELQAFVDPQHLKQILFNLVHNAIKFTLPGGEVQVVVRDDAGSPYLRIAVRDTGVGIPAHQLGNLFDPYARYRGSQMPAVETGVGLGLALCKTLSELNGGKIAVESVENCGSVFEVLLPRCQELERAESGKASGKAGQALYKPLLGQNFLVIDGDHGTRDSIAQLIEAWGGMVDRVSEATQAVDAVCKKSYDAIMIDDARDLSAVDLSRAIREDLQARETTIILTGRQPLDDGQVTQAGADKFIEKPLNGRLLLESLLNSGRHHAMN